MHTCTVVCVRGHGRVCVCVCVCVCVHARLMHERQHLCGIVQSFLRNSPAELTNEIAEGDVIVEVDKCVCVFLCVCV